MEEIWKGLLYHNKDYSMYYDISNFGRIRNSRNKYILKPQINQGGYYIVSTTMGSKKNIKGVVIHIAVANNFIPNPENKPTVNHKDGIKTNNHIDNLEWSTYKEQSEHAISNGLIKNDGENNFNSKCTKEDIFNILKDRNDGLSYRKLSKKYNLSKPSITNICKGISYKEYFRDYISNNTYNNILKKETIPKEIIKYIRESYIPFSKDFSSVALSKKLNIKLSTIKNILFLKIYKNI